MSAALEISRKDKLRLQSQTDAVCMQMPGYSTLAWPQDPICSPAYYASVTSPLPSSCTPLASSSPSKFCTDSYKCSWCCACSREKTLRCALVYRKSLHCKPSQNSPPWLFMLPAWVRGPGSWPFRCISSASCVGSSEACCKALQGLTACHAPEQRERGAAT